MSQEGRLEIGPQDKILPHNFSLLLAERCHNEKQILVATGITETNYFRLL